MLVLSNVLYGAKVKSNYTAYYFHDKCKKTIMTIKNCDVKICTIVQAYTPLNIKLPQAL